MVDTRLTEAINAMQEVIDKLLAEVGEKKKLANALARTAGLEPVYNEIEEVASGSSRIVRADQFANYTAPSPAVRKFLELRGEQLGATTVEVIYEALKAGGYNFEHAPPSEAKNNLKVSLGKDSEVLRLPNGCYGLLSWYPAQKREKMAKPKKGSNSAGTNGVSAEEAAAPPPKEGDA